LRNGNPPRRAGLLIIDRIQGGGPAMRGNQEASVFRSIKQGHPVATKSGV
jgi:hypothetical protein